MQYHVGSLWSVSPYFLNKIAHSLNFASPTDSSSTRVHSVSEPSEEHGRKC